MLASSPPEHTLGQDPVPQSLQGVFHASEPQMGREGCLDFQLPLHLALLKLAGTIHERGFAIAEGLLRTLLCIVGWGGLHDPYL
jgi:hypothetical protein